MRDIKSTIPYWDINDSRNPMIFFQNNLEMPPYGTRDIQPSRPSGQWFPQTIFHACLAIKQSFIHTLQTQTQNDTFKQRSRGESE
jgi:hypothetical protein